MITEAIVGQLLNMAEGLISLLPPMAQTAPAVDLTILGQWLQSGATLLPIGDILTILSIGFIVEKGHLFMAMVGWVLRKVALG